MSKSNIKQAQAILMANGYPLPRFGADGDFGGETMAAFTAAMSDLAAFKGGPVPTPTARPYIKQAAFAKWAPRAIPGTYEALEAAVAANPPLQEPLVLAHWLGQMWVESAGFSTLVENLNYSVDGLLKTFQRHRISEADARKYGRLPGRPANQIAIANIVYGGSFGRGQLGNTEPNDGWDYRGSGYKQRTGRFNAGRSKYTMEELRTDPVKAAMDAAAFFLDHNCVVPARRDDVPAVTRIINGGTNGLADRQTKTREAKALVL